MAGLHSTDEFTVSFDDSAEAKEAAYAMLLAFFIKHESFDGEVLMQSDNPQIEAPVVLSNIADDVFKFDVEWNE